jgi:hypothetical protein
LTGVALFAALIAAGWALIGAWLGRSYQSIARQSATTGSATETSRDG